MERKHNGKTYSVIMGKKKGEDTMSEQAYRYPTDTWTAAQARSHCSSHSGTFHMASGKAADCDDCTDQTGDLMDDHLIQKGPLARFYEHSDLEVRKDGTVTKVRFSASSENPVERWFGTEVLSHEEKAVKLSRARGGAMPLLFNHNINDPIGMVTEARLVNRRLMIDSTLFETPRATEVQSMMAGGLRNVSIAYWVNTLEEDKKNERFTATDWEPFEVSIVTVPADPSVGIGRNETRDHQIRMVRPLAGDSRSNKEENMDKENNGNATAASDTKPAAGSTTIESNGDGETRMTDPKQMEQMRKKAIENMCKANRLDDTYRDMWIGKGSSLNDVADELLLILEERGKTNPTSMAKIGMTVRETGRFSLTRAINACASNSWSKTAPFELECVQEVAKRMNLTPDPHKFYVPFEVLQRPIGGQRDLTAAGGAQSSNYLVSTTNVGFIDLLRNRSVIMRMGARNLSGLVGNVAIPRQSASGAVTWLANEASTISEINQTFVQVTMSPKNVGAYTEISRQLLLQSDPSAEAIVSNDLAQQVALAADVAGLTGTGAAGQPQGIGQTNGVNFVTTAASASYTTVVNQQVALASWNVMPAAGGYVTSPEMAGVFAVRSRFSNTDTPLWVGNIWDGNMGGFRAMSSKQVASANTVIFGDWSEMILAEWGVLEMEVNPYAGFTAGIVGVRAIYSMDIGIRRPFAFAIQIAVN